MRPPTTIFLALILVFAAATAKAQGWVSFLHTPPDVQPEGVALVLEGSLIGVSSGQRLDVRYRTKGESEWRAVTVVPAQGDLYQAVIPANQVRAPGIQYYLALVEEDGTERLVFASPTSPRSVRVDSAGTRREEQPDLSPPRAPEPAPPPPAPGPPPADDPSTPPTPVEPEAPAVIEHPFAAEERVLLAGATERSVEDAPAVMTVVSSRQIRSMGARTLSDVLKSVPGMETSRNVQGFHQVAVRGMRSDPEVLLLYDGRRLDNLYDGKKLYEMPIEHVDRVEVLRGPGATLHGTGAFLAVINVVPKQRDGLYAAGSVDTNGLTSLHAAFGTDLGAGRLQLEGDIDTGSGYEAEILTDAFDDDTRTPAGMTDDSRLLFHAGGSLTQPVGDGDLTVSLRGVHQNRGALVGAFDSVGENSSLGWGLLLGRARYDMEVAGAELAFGLSGDMQRASRRLQLTPREFESAGGHFFPDGIVEETWHRTSEIALDASTRIELFEGSLLSFGLVAGWQSLDDWGFAVNVDPETGQALEEIVTPTDIVFPAHDPGLTNRMILALHALNEWRVIDSLELTVGFRGDLFIGGVGRDDPAAPVGQRGTEFALTPRFGAVWSPVDDWTFKLLHATAFRVPTFQELTSRLVQGTVTRGRYEGNPTLSPVRIRTTEIGVDHGFTLVDRDFRIRVNGFVNEFLGRIEAVDLTGNITPLFNRDGVIRVVGAEGEGRMVFGARDWVSAGMAWFRAVDTQAPDGRNLLTTIPQLRLILRSQVGIGRWLDLQVGVLFGSERRNNARSSLEALRRFSIPPYALVDTTLKTRPIAERYSFALTIENLLDAPYHHDVPRPDRMTELLPAPGLSGRLTARMDW